MACGAGLARVYSAVMAGTAATLEPSAAESAAGSEMPDAAGQVPSGDTAEKSRPRRLLSAVTPNGMAVTVVGGLLAVIALLLADGFAGIDSQFDRIDGQFDRIDARFASIEGQFDRIDAKIDTQAGVLRHEIAQVRAELGTEIAQVRAEMGTEIAQVRTELGTEIAQARAEMNQGFAQVDGRFAEMNAVLLDHGERLARIEAAHGVLPHP